VVFEKAQSDGEGCLGDGDTKNCGTGSGIRKTIRDRGGKGEKRAGPVRPGLGPEPYFYPGGRGIPGECEKGSHRDTPIT